MSESLKDRFYTSVSVNEGDGGYAVVLDGCVPKSPGGKSLLVPTKALARAVAAEWDTQDPKIDLNKMPLTRLAFSALDQVANHRANVVDEVSAYAATDLICHRADAPQELVVRQQTHWDPICTWSADALNAPLATVTGVIAPEQPAASLKNIRKVIAEQDNFVVAALHMATKMAGSVILALALVQNHLTKEDAWAASRLDEDWQAEKWGQDDEAKSLSAQKQRDFYAAADFLKFLQ